MTTLKYKYAAVSLSALASVLVPFASPIAHGQEPNSIPKLTSFTALPAISLKALSHGRPVVKVEKIFTNTGKSAAISGDVLIDASPEQIWAVMTDCTRAPSFLPGLQSCEILSKDPNGQWDIRRHITKIGVFLPTVKSEFQNQYSFPRKIAFSRTGGNLKSLNGYWEFKPLPQYNKTRISYRAVLASDSVLPDAMLRKSISKRMPKVLKAICDEILKDKKLDLQSTEFEAPRQ